MDSSETRSTILSSHSSFPSQASDLNFGLEHLLHPLAPEVFKATFWERQPLVIHRHDHAYYHFLLSLSDVDHILAYSRIQSSDIRIVQNGQETPIDKLVSPGGNLRTGSAEAMYQAYRKGSTINLFLLQEQWPPLRRLCQSLAVELSSGVQANVYLTPPNARGLGTHYDTHDVFVLQTHGAKHWRVYGQPVYLPLVKDPDAPARNRDPGEPLIEITLNSGDLMYIPRGYSHDAVSLESTSLHLTIGIKSVTWGTVILNAIESAINQDPHLRESLPPGFADSEELRKQSASKFGEIMTSLFERIRPEAAIDEARNRAWLARYPSLEGHLLDLDVERFVDLDTTVRRREDIQLVLSKDGDSLSLHFHGKIVRMPADTETDVRFVVAEPGKFTAGDLPGGLDAEGKVLFIRRLLNEGFLTIG